MVEQGAQERKRWDKGRNVPGAGGFKGNGGSWGQEEGKVGAADLEG